MRGARETRDDRGVRESVGTVGVPLTALPVPVAALGQPPALPIRSDGPDPDPDLAWQSSIGQFIFLQSLAQDQI
jgi:hypothetical protein